MYSPDCNWEGWPSWEHYAIDMYDKAVGQPQQSYNASAAADGMVGDVLPTVVFYLPMFDNGTSQHRYWSYFAVPVADMRGSPEQSVWMRFQQIECAGPHKQPPCVLRGEPGYWDSYWYARFPGANASDTQRQTLSSGPVNASSAAGFYANLLENRRWWQAELAAEGMMQLSLPSPASTNGTWLTQQARHNFMLGMITWNRKWGSRYGVLPGMPPPTHTPHQLFV